MSFIVYFCCARLVIEMPKQDPTGDSSGSKAKSCQGRRETAPYLPTSFDSLWPAVPLAEVDNVLFPAAFNDLNPEAATL